MLFRSSPAIQSTVALEIANLGSATDTFDVSGTAPIKLTDGTTVTADEAYLKESIISPDAKVVKGFAPGIMPKNFGDKLKPDQIEALIEYMKTLK